jgi:hypothetical protein
MSSPAESSPGMYVHHSSPPHPLTTIQESEGSEGESEYDDAANVEEDELISDGEHQQEAVSHLRWSISFSLTVVQGPKRESDVARKAIEGAADGGATAEEAEAQSRGRQVAREAAGDGQGQGAPPSSSRVY